MVTNAHVIAGFDQLRVRDAAGEHAAVAIHFNPVLDVAVLAAPEVAAPAIGWTDTAATRGTEGATLGFPGGPPEMVVRPATVRGRIDAIGRDIYGRAIARREILAPRCPVQRGDSGGPFVTSVGLVGGVVFAGDPGDGATGYALTAEEVGPSIERAIAAAQQVSVGACRSNLSPAAAPARRPTRRWHVRPPGWPGVSASASLATLTCGRCATGGTAARSVATRAPARRRPGFVVAARRPPAGCCQPCLP